MHRHKSTRSKMAGVFSELSGWYFLRTISFIESNSSELQGLQSPKNALPSAITFSILSESCQALVTDQSNLLATKFKCLRNSSDKLYCGALGKEPFANKEAFIVRWHLKYVTLKTGQSIMPSCMVYGQMKITHEPIRLGTSRQSRFISVGFLARLSTIFSWSSYCDGFANGWSHFSLTKLINFRLLVFALQQL